VRKRSQETAGEGESAKLRETEETRRDHCDRVLPVTQSGGENEGGTSSKDAGGKKGTK
jgi:hypothetical protein